MFTVCQNWSTLLHRELAPSLKRLPSPALVKANRYRAKNRAAGKCGNCPEPLAKGSSQYCQRHLEINRKHQREAYARKKARAK
jgi:hypothetical protein